MAATANEALLDALVRHQTHLLRYSAYVRGRIWATLDRSEEGIATLVRDRLRNSTGLTTPEDVRRMEALLAAVDGLRREVWSDANKWLEQQLTDLSYNEPIVLRGIVATTAPVLVETVMPTAQLLKAIALSRPFEGRILKEWAQVMESDDLRRIHSAIQLGMVAGESSSVIARRVAGTGILKGADGVTEATRRQVAAVTRTAVMHVSSNARNEFIQSNADIIDAELYVATLDSRTTPVCKANDGKRFPVGSGPRPPLHWQCRSLRVAAFDGEMLGNRPAKASTTKQLLREFTEERKLPKVTRRDDLPHGTKTAYDAFARKRIRELTGQVPSSTSYQKWLERQSREFQEDTLGKTKAKLFRDGGLTLDKFVAADGSELTLAQLSVKSASAFRAAGLDPEEFN